MQKKKSGFSFSWLYCRLFGHKLRVCKNVTNYVHEYRCSKCGVEMTDTADGFVARLTPKFKATNNYLAKIHQKRKRRKERSKRSYAQAS